MKDAAFEFSQELLGFFGLDVVLGDEAPTELTRLVSKSRLMDYVWKDGDGNYVHFEFESGFLRDSDLRRFSEYVVLLSNKTKKEVNTFIVSSREIENKDYFVYHGSKMCYKPTVFSFKNYNGEQKFNNIKYKITNNVKLEKKDLLELSLIPLMKSENTTEAQVIKTVEIATKIKTNTQEEINKLMDRLHILIDKFVKNEKYKLKLMEDITMASTALKAYGEKIKKEYITIGEEKGIKKNKIETAKELLSRGYPIEEIISITKLNKEQIKTLK